MSDNPIEAAKIAAVLHLVGDAFTNEAKTEKIVTLNAMGRGTLYPTLPDGTELAAVNVPKPSTKVEVSDNAALLAWVKENYPTEVQTVEIVRPAFLERIKELSKKAGEPVGPGYELDVPGVEVRSIPPQSARVTPTEAGRKLAAHLVEQAKANAIDYLSRPALTSGDAA